MRYITPLIRLLRRISPKHWYSYATSKGLIGIVRRVDKRAYIDVALSQRAKKKGITLIYK